MLDQLPLPIEIYTLWGNLSIIEYGKKSFGSKILGRRFPNILVDFPEQIW
jgi:hypothetical protein